jgi:hypothetical protein
MRRAVASAIRNTPTSPEGIATRSTPRPWPATPTPNTVPSGSEAGAGRKSRTLPRPRRAAIVQPRARCLPGRLCGVRGGASGAGIRWWRRHSCLPRPHSWGRVFGRRPNVSAGVRTRHAESVRHVGILRAPDLVGGARSRSAWHLLLLAIHEPKWSASSRKPMRSRLTPSCRYSGGRGRAIAQTHHVLQDQPHTPIVVRWLLRHADHARVV